MANVPQNWFRTRPNVDSAVITLTLHEQPPVDAKNRAQLLRIIKDAFSQRRKTLLNTLASNGELGVPKDKLKEMLDESGIGATTRGETLSLEEFARLSDYIDSHR